MLNCLTYIAFVYWAVATVHTILPIDVGVCGADPSRGGLGALLHHTFGGEVDIDASAWAGFPCNGGLLSKMGFLLQRPRATVAHILSGGGQDEPFVPILFLVPIIFCALTCLRAAGLRLCSETACRTFLKFGVAVGCRGVILLQALAYPGKQSLYFKRYSKVEFFIVGWTAYIIELPVWHEALVSGGTLATILAMCVTFPHYMAPEVNPWNVALQGIAATAFGVGHAYYQQRLRARQTAALAARAAARAAAAAGKFMQAQEPSFPDDDASCSKAAAAAAAAAAGSSGAAAPAPASPAAPPSSCSLPSSSSSSTSPPSGPPSLAAVRRIQALRRRPYVSPARPCRVAIKVQSAHLGDVPPDLLELVNRRMLEGSGWQAVGAYAREGCIELVLDLRPLVAHRVPYDDTDDADAAAADDSRAVSDQNPRERAPTAAAATATAAAAAATGGNAEDGSLGALGRALVSFLHSAGLVDPDVEPTVTLQINETTAVMEWQRELQAWAPAGSSAAAAAAAAVPSLELVAPAVALWPGRGEPLRLRATLAGPSAAEILSGGGLVVRCGPRPLPYSVVQVTEAAAAARHVELAVHGVPPSGLLRLEARSPLTGLLSAPLPVVVDHDGELVAGLAALAAALDRRSYNALLLDYGSWLDAAAAAVASGGSTAAAAMAAAAAPGGGKAAAHGGALPRASSLAALAGGVSPAADLPYTAMPYLDVAQERAQEARPRVWCAEVAPRPAPLTASEPRLVVAADLLAAACQHGGADVAVAAVVDRLIAMVVALAAAADTPPAAALAALFAAVPAPPTNAGALHLAVASGAKSIVEVLLRWHQRVAAAGGGGSSDPWVGADPWVTRATCDITPLHVAAALPDGGALAGWALRRSPAAAVAWRTALSDDGMTPAALAARLGGRWRLRLWDANPVVAAARRALSPPEPVGRALELLWAFSDPALERRYAETVSSQAVVTLALYAAANAALPLLSLTKATLAGSCLAALSALAFHVPHIAPLLAWLAGPTAANALAPTTMTRAKPASRSASSPGASFPGGGALAALTGGAGGGGGLRGALVAMQVCRAAAKAAVGLSLWPAAAALLLPRGAAVFLFLAHGGDIAVEAVARPLLEQVGLPARLLVSLVDAPAQLLLYRWLEARQPGTFPRPLERLALYQVVLLATTAAADATNRVRFLRSERARAAWLAGAAAATAAAAAAAAAAPQGSQAPPGASGGKAAPPPPDASGVTFAHGGGGGSGSGSAAVAVVAARPRA